MGEQNVKPMTDEESRQGFMRSLLKEVQALEDMLERGMIETGKARIGAEQEMFIVKRSRQPALKALELLERINDDRFTHEIGLFNLEANMSVQEVNAHCLDRLEAETREIYQLARRRAAEMDLDIALVGILPTLSREHLSLDAMVPSPRYFALNDALRALRGKDFEFTINGIDQLNVKHDNVMLEACNTSFQVHLQVEPDRFARIYNIAQLVTAPLMAAAVNSPILLGHRLWHESRIAVFEHSIDARSETHQARGLKPRVHFGDRWVDESVVEIFKEDIARFRVILTTECEEDVLAMVERGEAPSLNALRLHNGTVYRWNRPCYGVHDGIAHLRIENRVIPSGPTVLDEIANAAFFFGMVAGMDAQEGDIRERLAFDDVKANFLAAARDGLRAQLNWFGDRYLTAQELILEELLPLARSGLDHMGIAPDSAARYLDVIRDRVEARRTGARWLLESAHKMQEQGTRDQRMRCLVSSMIDQQSGNLPISRWQLAEFCEQLDFRDSYQFVSQFMVTDLFTVRADDIVDFAASLMDWRHVRHVPVEGDDGELVGLVSHRSLLRLVATGRLGPDKKVTVREIMNSEPVTVAPETSTVQAIRLMREGNMACLPVVKDGKLVGLVTEHDLIVVSSMLLERYLAAEE
ncbi:MAG: CBS domain-containing protein [Xanthomonadales bacterium]|nr:CBS domain-containing protein [Xanthomonadales bacterium]